jgi:tetraacyldisaccharide 4'-kinase
LKRPLLLPFVPLYGVGLALRAMRLQRGWESVRRLRYPVISIGNLSTGGSGKTPLAIALARLLSARGFEVDVLSRGHGRSGRETMRVRAVGTAEQFGDEPLLIAREARVPVYVARERFEAGRLAETEAPLEDVNGKRDSAADSRRRVHILDDGFQHRQLARDVDILLLNREDWHDRLLPAGNLREPLDAAKRASIIAIPANESGFEDELRDWGWTGPVWRIRRRVEFPRVDGPVAAFCGIARPQQFFDGFKIAGLSLVSTTAFGDHHRYSQRDIARLVSEAQAAGATAIITTEKDEVRLGDLLSAFPPTLPLKTARLHVELEDEREALSWLEERAASSGGFGA